MSGDNSPPYSNPWLKDLVPHSATHGKFKPKEGARLTLHLPGETISVLVRGVVSDDACVVEIDTIPMSRSHFYRKGQIVAARRGVDELLQTEKWEVVPEDELNAAEVSARLRRDEEEREARERARIASEAGQAALPAPPAVEAQDQPDAPVPGPPGNWSA